METTVTYARPELLQVADTVARDKGIDRDEVLEAMEQAIQKAGRSKYGQEYDIRAEIDRRSGEWIDVPVIPGAYVVNIGDLMSVWTNDLWHSTKHRVRVPPAEKRSIARVSIPFFHTPNWLTQVECLPSCSSPERPAQYEPVASGTYLLGKIQAAYA